MGYSDNLFTLSSARLGITALGEEFGAFMNIRIYVALAAALLVSLPSELFACGEFVDGFVPEPPQTNFLGLWKADQWSEPFLLSTYVVVASITFWRKWPPGSKQSIPDPNANVTPKL